MTTEITVTKIDAARRQLRMAIELWFADGDPVSTHTLARAAYQIIHDLNKRKKGPELLFDTTIVKDEYKHALRALLKNPSDFMKHADRGKVGMLTEISFNPDLSRGFILFAIFGLGYLQQNLAPEEKAFQLWHALHKPDLFHEVGQQLLKNGVDANAANALRALPKHELFKRALGGRWKPW